MSLRISLECPLRDGCGFAQICGSSWVLTGPDISWYILFPLGCEIEGYRNPHTGHAGVLPLDHVHPGVLRFTRQVVFHVVRCFSDQRIVHVEEQNTNSGHWWPNFEPTSRTMSNMECNSEHFQHVKYKTSPYPWPDFFPLRVLWSGFIAGSGEHWPRSRSQETRRSGLFHGSRVKWMVT